MINWLVNWLTDKRESNTESPVSENTGLPLLPSSAPTGLLALSGPVTSFTGLPLRSGYATMVRTNAYTEGVETDTQKISLESTWLLARCVGNAWDIISYKRELKADGSFTTSAKIEKGNKGVTYAHVVCCLAKYEHIRLNDPIILKDEDVDQHTTAKHFIYVANHDGIGFDVGGNPHISENGEFFTGEFSEEQRAAVYRFHHNPELQKISDQSIVQDAFSKHADIPLFENIDALKEVETLMAVKHLLETAYTKRLNSIMTGTDCDIAVGCEFAIMNDVRNVEVYDGEGENISNKIPKLKVQFDAVESLSALDKQRTLQLLEKIPSMIAMGRLRLLEIKKDIPVVSGNSSTSEKSTLKGPSDINKVKEEARKLLKRKITNEFQDLDKGNELEEITASVENFARIAGTDRGHQIFAAESRTVASICAMLDTEIKRLNAIAVAQTNKETILLDDPQTGKPRKYTL